MEKNENLRILDELLDKITNGDTDETLFACYGEGEDGVTLFNGNVEHVAVAIYKILKCGLAYDANDREIDLANAILNGFYYLISEFSEESMRLGSLINEMYNSVLGNINNSKNTKIGTKNIVAS